MDYTKKQFITFFIVDSLYVVFVTFPLLGKITERFDGLVEVALTSVVVIVGLVLAAGVASISKDKL